MEDGVAVSLGHGRARVAQDRGVGAGRGGGDVQAAGELSGGAAARDDLQGGGPAGLQRAFAVLVTVTQS
ncbi:hypothetical protein [Lentzea nigeriaca]|uniref:hypothetical protein n=1 Tax=Lentzea nigeriaca TaxID=1128665 RepID=UPI001956CDF5|nr:hypothetical protein [Lentzea nigeriaca]MBM7863476.1 hypothetical protein [Lentzea nigeriaca]